MRRRGSAYRGCRRGFLYRKGQFSDVLVLGKKGSIPMLFARRNHLRLRSRRRLFHAFRSMAECSLVCSPRVALSRFSTSTCIHVSGARWQDHRALCESGRRRNDAAAWSASTASVAAASVGWLVSSVRKVGHEHTSSVGRSSCRFRLAGAQETQVGSTPRTAAKGETTGCGLKPRRAFDWQQRCRLR